MIDRQAQQSVSDKGFTLLELLISVAVFAVLSVMAYGGLNNVISNNTQSQLALDRLQQVQRTILIFSRDINQLTLRNIRDEYGNPQPYLNTSSQTGQLVEFTRGGRRNPALLLRSNMLRVAYKVEDNQLIRLFWTQLDRAPGTEPYEAILLNKVNNAELRYLDQTGDWHDLWPPISGAAISDNSLQAIEFTLELEDWGKIQRLYKVAT